VAFQGKICMRRSARGGELSRARRCLIDERRAKESDRVRYIFDVRARECVNWIPLVTGGHVGLARLGVLVPVLSAVAVMRVGDDVGLAGVRFAIPMSTMITWHERRRTVVMFVGLARVRVLVPVATMLAVMFELIRLAGMRVFIPMTATVAVLGAVGLARAIMIVPMEPVFAVMLGVVRFA